MIQADFGIGKVSTFKEWSGKERRLLQQIIDDNKITSSALNKILISDCETSDKKYYNVAESNYIMYLNYAASFGEDLNVKWTCSHCKSENVNTVLINELIKNCEKIKLDSFIIKDLKFVFGNPTYTTEELETFNLLTRNSDRMFYNMLFHISSVEKNGEKIEFANKMSEIENLIEELDINDFDLLYDYYYSNEFQFSPMVDMVCEHCSNHKLILCDYLPSIIG